ncbi:hypothetical protein ACFZDI_31375 [Streptomyces sp. NPDC007907]|uniref:hypothetical protein n=1 Tax=Streptomyces sp. NPDC007907 TaxID=3364789 RepID=UPI0036E8F8DD
MSDSTLRITFALPDEGRLPDPGALSEESREALASAWQQAAERRNPATAGGQQERGRQDAGRPRQETGQRQAPGWPEAPASPRRPSDTPQGPASGAHQGPSVGPAPRVPLQPGQPLDRTPTGPGPVQDHSPGGPGPAQNGPARNGTAPGSGHHGDPRGRAPVAPHPHTASQSPPAPPSPPATPPAAAQVVPDGAAAFILVPDADGYLLPDVLLELVGPPAHLTAHLPAQVEVQQPEGERLPGLLTNALARSWSAGGHGTFPVDGPRRISHGARLPLFAVHPHGSATASGRDTRPLSVTVSWRVQYTGPTTQGTAHASAVLRLWPPGLPAPAPRPHSAEYLVLRKPERWVEGLAAAVDFGTTASTVTLLGRAHTGGQVDAHQAAALARQLSALTAPPDDAPRAWRSALEALRAGQLEIGGPSGRTLGGSEALTQLDNLAVATRVLLWVEEVRATAEEQELRDWLVEQLHRVVTATVRTPALDLHQLAAVEFGYGQGTTPTRAPATSLREVHGNQDRPGVSRARGLAFELTPEETEGITGIKRKLLTTPGGRASEQGPTPVHLAQHVYHLLADRAERVAHGEDTGTPGHLSAVLLTFPTSATPAARTQLVELVQRGLSVPHVELLIDEGLAAGLYFVMRDLTANLDVGLEALRAASRPVPGEPDTWRSIMLVVDIGGGTTDIALLDLVLRDLTPALDPADRFTSGRAYMLEPRILGTIGHGQLGGDLLTLLVLYWVKATLLDKVGRGDPDHTGEPLSARVARQAGGHREHLVSSEVRELLRRELPTHWRELGRDLEDAEEAQQREAGFSTLWRLAERVKRALGEENGDTGLTEDELADLRQRFEPLKGLAGPVVFSQDEFRDLIEPFVRQAAEMAAGLVSDAFRRMSAHAGDRAGRAGGSGATDAAPYLDQVVLAGRSSTMAAVRRAVNHALRRADHLHGKVTRKVEWNPERLEVETGFLAKQATSLGAAWLHRVRGRVGAFGTGSGGLIHSELSIVTQGLFSCLPCDFVLQGLAAMGVELFSSGTPFEQLGPDGSLGLASPWRPVVRTPSVIRPRAGSSPIPWGILEVENRARRAGCDLSSPAWDFDHGAEMRFRIRVDERLNLTAEFRHGPRQHYWLPDDPTTDGRGALALNNRAGLRFAAHQPMVRVPGDICAASEAWGSPGCVLRDVFPAEEGEAGAPLLTYFPDLFHLGARPDPLVEPTPGRIAELHLSEQAHATEFLYFYVRDPGGGDPVFLDKLPVPAANPHAQSSPVRVTLDARGELRLHRGALRMPEAESFVEAEQRPGWVYCVPMEITAREYQSGWDPDSGEH